MNDHLNDLQESYDRTVQIAEITTEALKDCIETANHNGRAVDIWRAIAVVLLVIVIILAMFLANQLI